MRSSRENVKVARAIQAHPGPFVDSTAAKDLLATRAIDGCFYFRQGGRKDSRRGITKQLRLLIVAYDLDIRPVRSSLGTAAGYVVLEDRIFARSDVQLGCENVVMLPGHLDQRLHEIMLTTRVENAIENGRDVGRNEQVTFSDGLIPITAVFFMVALRISN